MVKVFDKLLYFYYMKIVVKIKIKFGICKYFIVYYEGRTRDNQWIKGDIHYNCYYLSKLNLIEVIKKKWLEKGYELNDIFILGLYQLKNRLEYNYYVKGLSSNDISENKNIKSSEQ